MDAKKCDRCGSFYEIYDDPEKILNKTLAYVGYYDLCPKCNLEFKRWMNGHHEVFSLPKDDQEFDVAGIAVPPGYWWAGSVYCPPTE